jgi:metallo-beta-lactamase class B
MDPAGAVPVESTMSDSTLLALNDPELQRVEPFQIFDNLYYVGTDWVSCYALTTSEGIVLIDALYGDLPILAVENLELLGLNPTDIRYVLVTHGHFDHAGGAAFFQETFGARVGMTQADWDLAAIEAKGRFFTPGAPRPDLVPISTRKSSPTGICTNASCPKPRNSQAFLSHPCVSVDP